MSDIVLLSEIHPDRFHIFPHATNPISQAINWHKIISLDDFQGKKINIIDAIKLIESKCSEKSKKLVIRDLAHLDFVGLPDVKPPSFKFLLAEILSYDFEVIQFAILRHPLDQWLSIKKSIPTLVHVDLDVFLKGYLEYVKQIKEYGFIRFEDFIFYPEKQMQVICNKLHLKFDRNFLIQWSSYDKITGDMAETGQHSRAKELKKIIPLPRRPVDKNTIRQFEQSNDYWEALKLADYKHEEV